MLFWEVEWLLNLKMLPTKLDISLIRTPSSKANCHMSKLLLECSKNLITRKDCKLATSLQAGTHMRGHKFFLSIWEELVWKEIGLWEVQVVASFTDTVMQTTNQICHSKKQNNSVWTQFHSPWKETEAQEALSD